jgi:hypothetical protein
LENLSEGILDMVIGQVDVPAGDAAQLVTYAGLGNFKGQTSNRPSRSGAVPKIPEMKISNWRRYGLVEADGVA